MSNNTREDPRKIGLKAGLRQLTIGQLERVLNYPNEMILDEFNYNDGKFCPLAVAVGLENMKNPTNDKVCNELVSQGFCIYNTRGISGKFYTTNRKDDLIEATKEVIEEKKNEFH